MRINQEQLEVLLDKYLNSELDSTQELDAWFLEEIAKGRFKEEIALHRQAIEAIKQYREKQNFKKMLSAIELPDEPAANPFILGGTKDKFPPSLLSVRWTAIGIGIAASVLAGAIYLWRSDELPEKPIISVQSPPDSPATEPALENKTSTFPASKGKETEIASAPEVKESNVSERASKSTPAPQTSNITFATIPQEEDLGFTASQNRSYSLEYRQDENAELFKYKIMDGNALKVVGPARLSEIKPLKVKSGAFSGKLNGLYFSWGGNYYFFEDLTLEDAWKTTKLIENPRHKDKLETWEETLSPARP